MTTATHNGQEFEAAEWADGPTPADDGARFQWKATTHEDGSVTMRPLPDYQAILDYNDGIE